jgi:drug/metabolite transporter (DMT)-like permease
MTLGMLGVAVTAACYGVSTILQAVAARRSRRSAGLDARLLVSLLGQLPFLVSLLLDGVGFLASVLALRTLPLFLVESAVASSVGVTALVAVRFLGARLRRPELLALSGLALGLALLAVSAQSGGARPLSTWAAWAMLAGVGLVLAVGAAAARLPDRSASAVLALAAGAAFGGTGIAARTLALPDPLWRLVLAPLPWALAGYGVLGMLLFAVSLQRGPVTTAAALTFVAETLLPAAVGLWLLGDRARSGFAVVAGAGFVLSLVGSVVLARFAELEPARSPRARAR